MTLHEAIETWVKKEFNTKYFDRIVDDLALNFERGNSKTFYVMAWKAINKIRKGK